MKGRKVNERGSNGRGFGGGGSSGCMTLSGRRRLLLESVSASEKVDRARTENQLMRNRRDRKQRKKSGDGAVGAAASIESPRLSAKSVPFEEFIPNKACKAVKYRDRQCSIKHETTAMDWLKWSVREHFPLNKSRCESSNVLQLSWQCEIDSELNRSLC